MRTALRSSIVAFGFAALTATAVAQDIEWPVAPQTEATTYSTNDIEWPAAPAGTTSLLTPAGL